MEEDGKEHDNRQGNEDADHEGKAIVLFLFFRYQLFF